jgi:hypothetical protein
MRVRDLKCGLAFSLVANAGKRENTLTEVAQVIRSGDNSERISSGAMAGNIVVVKGKASFDRFDSSLTFALRTVTLYLSSTRRLVGSSRPKLSEDELTKLDMTQSELEGVDKVIEFVHGQSAEQISTIPDLPLASAHYYYHNLLSMTTSQVNVCLTSYFGVKLRLSLSSSKTLSFELAHPKSNQYDGKERVL